MYQRINQHDFIDAFRQRDRLDTPDSDGGNFTIDGCRALFDYLEEFEDGTGEEMQFDPIALCCDFAEHDDPMEALFEYAGRETTEAVEGDADECREQAIDWLRDQTTVIEIPGTDRIIIQSF